MVHGDAHDFGPPIGAHYTPINPACGSGDFLPKIIGIPPYSGKERLPDLLVYDIGGEIEAIDVRRVAKFDHGKLRGGLER